MKLRFLYTLGLLLCLSNFASPNECAKHCPGTAATSSDEPAATGPALSPIAPSPAPAASSEAYSPTLIKLLYI